jgi:hypothetical protein
LIVGLHVFLDGLDQFLDAFEDPAPNAFPGDFTKASVSRRRVLQPISFLNFDFALGEMVCPEKVVWKFVVKHLLTKAANSFVHFASFARQLYQISTGPRGTGICSRCVEAGSVSRMNDATIGG